jgi:hypothetical protein
MKFKNKQDNLLWLEVKVAVGKGGSTIGGGTREASGVLVMFYFLLLNQHASGFIEKIP